VDASRDKSAAVNPKSKIAIASLLRQCLLRSGVRTGTA
jgi:hypothetical protein